MQRKHSPQMECVINISMYYAGLKRNIILEGRKEGGYKGCVHFTT
jgi:hypothetical protein